MEIKLIDEKKNRIEFDISGVSHGFCNVLKKELWNDKHIKIASYKVEHPLTAMPRFIIETDGDITPKAALINAAERLGKEADKVKKELVKEIK